MQCNSFILKCSIHFACTNLNGSQKEGGNFLICFRERGQLGRGFQPWRELWQIVLLVLFLTVKRQPPATEIGFHLKIFSLFSIMNEPVVFLSPFAVLPIATNLFSKSLLLFFSEKIIWIHCNKNWNKKLRKNKVNNSN